jgi:hypothetical protein
MQAWLSATAPQKTLQRAPNQRNMILSMSRKNIILVLLLVFAVLAALFLTAAIVFWVHLNTIAQKSIEKVLSHVLQVEVSLKKVNVSPFRGKVELHGLVIKNPEGFKTSESFSVNTISVKADIKSFRTARPTVTLISLRGPHVTLEQGFKESNIGRLIKNASRLQEKEAEEAAPPAARKKILIQTLIVDRAKVSLSAPVLQGNEITFPLPRIELNGIGDEKHPVTVATAVQVVLTEIFASALEAAKTSIPPELEKALRNSLQAAIEGIGDAANLLKGEATKIGKQLKRGTDLIEKKVDKLQQGIKGLLKRD